MVQRKHIGKFWMLAAMFAVGCDPVRSMQQAVTVKVIASASREPVANAQVSLRFDFATANQTKPREVNLTPDEWRDHVKTVSDNFPWFDAVTNTEGCCTLAVTWTGIDRTSGPMPPKDSDSVTGKPYLIRVKTTKSQIDACTVVMRRGPIVTKEPYTIIVIDIQEPRYIDLPSTHAPLIAGRKYCIADATKHLPLLATLSETARASATLLKKR